MSGNSKHGFTADQINNPKYITVFIEAAYNSQQRGGTYGAVWAGNGQEGELWGGGNATIPEPLSAFAIERLLTKFPSDTIFSVYGPKGLWSYIEPKRGHVRHAMQPDTWGLNKQGYPMPGFEPFELVARAYDDQRFQYQSLDKLKKRDRNYPPRHAAMALAEGPAHQQFLDYRRANPSPAPSCAIVVQG